MGVDVTTTSRLLFSQFLSLDGFNFWDMLDLPDFVARPGDLSRVVLAGDRLDLLAFKYYNDAGFWWVIAWANGLEILPTDLKQNSTIIIPDPSFVVSQLLPAPSNTTTVQSGT